MQRYNEKKIRFKNNQNIQWETRRRCRRPTFGLTAIMHCQWRIFFFDQDWAISFADCMNWLTWVCSKKIFSSFAHFGLMDSCFWVLCCGWWGCVCAQLSYFFYMLLPVGPWRRPVMIFGRVRLVLCTQWVLITLSVDFGQNFWFLRYFVGPWIRSQHGGRRCEALVSIADVYWARASALGAWDRVWMGRTCMVHFGPLLVLRNHCSFLMKARLGTIAQLIP